MFWVLGHFGGKKKIPMKNATCSLLFIFIGKEQTTVGIASVGNLFTIFYFCMCGLGEQTQYLSTVNKKNTSVIPGKFKITQDCLRSNSCLEDCGSHLSLVWQNSPLSCLRYGHEERNRAIPSSAVTCSGVPVLVSEGGKRKLIKIWTFLPLNQIVF